MLITVFDPMSQIQQIDGASRPESDARRADRLPDAEALDAYSRTISEMAARLAGSVADLRVQRASLRVSIADRPFGERPRDSAGEPAGARAQPARARRLAAYG